MIKNIHKPLDQSPTLYKVHYKEEDTILAVSSGNIFKILHDED